MGSRQASRGGSQDPDIRHAAFTCCHTVSVLARARSIAVMMHFDIGFGQVCNGWPSLDPPLPVCDDLSVSASSWIRPVFAGRHDPHSIDLRLLQHDLADYGEVLASRSAVSSLRTNPRSALGELICSPVRGNSPEEGSPRTLSVLSSPESGRVRTVCAMAYPSSPW